MGWDGMGGKTEQPHLLTVLARLDGHSFFVAQTQIKHSRLHPSLPPHKLLTHTRIQTHSLPSPSRPFTQPQQATDIKTGIYNLSPLFELSSEKRRRKLYGPIMWA